MSTSQVRGILTVGLERPRIASFEQRRAPVVEQLGKGVRVLERQRVVAVNGLGRWSGCIEWDAHTVKDCAGRVGINDMR